MHKLIFDIYYLLSGKSTWQRNIIFTVTRKSGKESYHHLYMGHLHLPDGIPWHTSGIFCDAQDYLGMKEGVRSPASAWIMPLKISEIHRKFCGGLIGITCDTCVRTCVHFLDSWIYSTLFYSFSVQ